MFLIVGMIIKIGARTSQLKYDAHLHQLKYLLKEKHKLCLPSKYIPVCPVLINLPVSDLIQLSKAQFVLLFQLPKSRRLLFASRLAW